MRFSLIIPCYNESKNLPKLLENCKNILKNNIELILVNNGSFDNSNTVLKKLKKKNTKIHIVSIKKNVGYGHGILAGLNKVIINLISKKLTKPNSTRSAYYYTKRKNKYLGR
jgi:glycosyltransferase involved in cell wall biosynthesis